MKLNMIEFPNAILVCYIIKSNKMRTISQNRIWFQLFKSTYRFAGVICFDKKEHPLSRECDVICTIVTELFEPFNLYLVKFSPLHITLIEQNTYTFRP